MHLRPRALAAGAAALALAAGYTGATSSVAQAAISSTLGEIVQVAVAPPSVVEDAFENDTNAQAFNERQGVVLGASVPVDITGPGAYTWTTVPGGTVAAGRIVDSHLITADPVGRPIPTAAIAYDGSITFASDIVGVAILSTTLDSTDPLGTPGTVYPTGNGTRGLEQGDLAVLNDLRTLRFHLILHRLDQIRVLTATPTTSATRTEVHDSAHGDITSTSVVAGTPVHDKAFVTGAVTGAPATGTVTFTRYATGNCTGPATTTEVVTLAANGTAESATVTPAVGSWGYVATYSGDANYPGSVGVCEPFTVRPAQVASSTRTEVHNPAHTDVTNGVVATGTMIHDLAVVTGAGPVPTGSVTFRRYAGGTCTGTVLSTETVALDATGRAESTPVAAASGGASYLASYTGDAAYLASTAPCEPFQAESTGAQGCTPGYWKQSQHFRNWAAPYTPSTKFSTVFGRTPAGDPTLLTVLQTGGGGLNALGRMSVASLLSATAPGVNFAYTSSDVLRLYREAFDSGRASLIESTKNNFDRALNAGCPLN